MSDFRSGKSSRLQIDPARCRPIYSTNPCHLMLFVREGFLASPKRNAPRPFPSRLSRCRLTFTKLPMRPGRYGVSRLAKASTTSRSGSIPRPAKYYAVSSLAVTAYSFAEDRSALRSVRVAHIRSDRAPRWFAFTTPQSSSRFAPDRIRRAAPQNTRRSRLLAQRNGC